MRVAIVYNAVAADAPAQDRDVLAQVDAVAAALAALGHSSRTIACTLDLAALRRSLEASSDDVVFNLVESLDGDDRLIGVAPAIYETLGLPFTGAGSAAMLLTSDKLIAKERLAQSGLPTPDWCAPSRGPGSPGSPIGDVPDSGLARPFIVKTVSEHGSFGLGAASVFRDDAPLDCVQAIARESARLSRECFAERYIAGREFNLSLLSVGGEPEVLPPAEIDFSSLPPGSLAIVGYDAKWREDSAEYQGTPRTFDFSAGDRLLLEELRRLALLSWRRFGLRGYARVDFRVDEAGQPWILEINANPCLSPDAGFAAAAARAGLSFAEVVERILNVASV